MKLYHYVGPEEVRRRAADGLLGTKVESTHDLKHWLHRTGQQPNREGQFVVTFVVDEHGILHIADRGSEHVACAEGGPVRSAGEMFLLPTDGGLRVEAVSNQSTGYLPGAGVVACGGVGARPHRHPAPWAVHAGGRLQALPIVR